MHPCGQPERCLRKVFGIYLKKQNTEGNYWTSRGTADHSRILQPSAQMLHLWYFDNAWGQCHLMSLLSSLVACCVCERQVMGLGLYANEPLARTSSHAQPCVSAEIITHLISPHRAWAQGTLLGHIHQWRVSGLHNDHSAKPTILPWSLTHLEGVGGAGKPLGHH